MLSILQYVINSNDLITIPLCHVCHTCTDKLVTTHLVGSVMSMIRR